MNKSIQINGRWSDVIITVNKGSDDLFSINILKEKDGTSARRFKYIIPEKDYLDILKLQPDGNICSKLTTLNVLTVRVRIKNKKSAKLTIKGETKGISRPEFEYDIPLSDAVVLMKYCRSNVVNKVRYEKEYKGNVFEIDVFTGINAGLVLAEVEMDDPDADIDLPFFIGEDVSHSEKYYNECIAAKNAFKYCKIGENKFIEIYKNIRVINHTSQMNLTFISLADVPDRLVLNDIGFCIMNGVVINLIKSDDNYQILRQFYGNKIDKSIDREMIDSFSDSMNSNFLNYTMEYVNNFENKPLKEEIFDKSMDLFVLNKSTGESILRNVSFFTGGIGVSPEYKGCFEYEMNYHA